MLVAAGFAAPAAAERLIIAAGASDLQTKMDGAAAGDVIHLLAGEHHGPVRVSRRITLEGAPGALLVGNGKGSVVTVSAPAAVIRNLTIRGSGTDLEAMDAGVFLEQAASGAVVEGNQIEGNLYGVYVHGAEGAIVQRNRITGMRRGRVNETGNGVSVWNATGAKVLANEIEFGRDGIFVITSRRNVFRGNRFRNVRFAIHYMYTNDSEISDNVSIGNTVGFALMYSHRLRVQANLSDGDRDHGILLNYANASEIRGNAVIGRLQAPERWLTAGMHASEASAHGVPREGSGARPASARNGPEKCVFIYNANQNRLQDNWFEGCEIGIHFTAGSERNEIAGNSFVNNRNQVKYVGSRYLDWSQGGRGNYWSDNPAFDLSGDGIADTAYRPNDLVDKVLWTAPTAKVLINSPAMQVIRWAQSQFPALLPGGVIDSHPLIRAPAQPAIAQEGRK